MVNEKRKIAFIIQSLGLGGAQRVISTLANNFIESYKVTIITFINEEPFYKLNNNIQVISCYEEMNPSSNSLEALRSNYLLFKKVNSIVKNNKFDILIGFMTTANVLTTMVGRLNKLPVIISERTNPYHQKLPKSWKFLRTISYRFSNMLVVQSEVIKYYFEGNIPENKLVILPNPLSIEFSNKRLLNNSSEKKNIILSVGRLVKSKSFDVLIRAFAQTNYTKWELWIAGDGPEFNNLLKLTIELNLRRNVKLLGLVKDISTLYNSSKIFAFSSTFEGFPNTLIEAMHFGLACISTDCPTGPSELIQDGENGYLVPINDIDLMSLKMSDLMESDSTIQDFGNKSVVAVQSFEEQNVVAKWKKIINNLIESSDSF
ncbi:MAG: glycosyltransferase family 4 protein [Bacteroidia bacterium]|nr:glycosyltransferase family 4 protein [Bacteroidia bacterium]